MDSPRWDSISWVQRYVTTWASDAFPSRKADGVFKKLLQELGELAANPNGPHEYADILVLLFDYASMHNIDIPKALEEKMGINIDRQWKWDHTTGMAQHADRFSERKMFSPRELDEAIKAALERAKVADET